MAAAARALPARTPTFAFSATVTTTALNARLFAPARNRVLRLSSRHHGLSSSLSLPALPTIVAGVPGPSPVPVLACSAVRSPRAPVSVFRLYTVGTVPFRFFPSLSRLFLVGQSPPVPSCLRRVRRRWLFVSVGSVPFRFCHLHRVRRC